MSDSTKWENGVRRGRTGVCVADQQFLYSPISKMKIATHVKVEVFTETRTREGREGRGEWR